MATRRKKRHSLVVQTHHIQYRSLDGSVPDITVRVWKGEHFIVHLLGRRKRISKGFIVALKDWLEKNEKHAEELK